LLSRKELPFRHRVVQDEQAQGGEIAGGQNRSPREELVLDARIICARRFGPDREVDDRAGWDESVPRRAGIDFFSTPTLLHSVQV
jgi:hypothetical protein